MADSRLRRAGALLAIVLCPLSIWGCGKDASAAGGVGGATSAAGGAGASSGASSSGGTGAAGATGGAGGGGGAGGSAPAVVCGAYAEGIAVGTLADPDIGEASGLAASRKRPGVLWVHNDSGDSPRLFALDRAGKSLGVFPLDGAVAVDWEDMALGPGPVAGSDYLYVADVGDNASLRSGVQVYRVPEPALDLQAPGSGQLLTDVEALELRYPDGPHDAETLLVDPESGDLYLIQKTFGPSGVYRAPAPLVAGAAIQLERVGEVNFGSQFGGISPLTTGGDIAPDRSFVIIRTYAAVLAWSWPRGSSLAQALAEAPCELPSQSEPQGEAIAIGAEGYLTVSEGQHEPIYAFGLVE